VLHKFTQLYLTLSNISSLDEELELESLKLPRKCESCVKLEDVVCKSVKCIANLAHDGNCRDLILKAGVGISILKIMESYNLEFLKVKAAQTQASSVESKEGLLKWFTEIDKDNLRNCIRAVRILSSEPFCSEEARVHLIRFGSVITMGKVLTWNFTGVQLDDIHLDIVRALISLTDRIRLLPGDQIAEVFLTLNLELSELIITHYNFVCIQAS